MKKKLCKTLRTMSNKLPQTERQLTEYEYGRPGKEKLGMRETVHPVNHYRRLKRLLVKGGTQAVKIYFDKHKTA